MDSNKIFGIVVILFFTGLSIGVVIFLMRAKEMNKDNEVKDVKDKNVLREAKDMKENDIKDMKENDIKDDTVKDVTDKNVLREVKKVNSSLVNPQYNPVSINPSITPPSPIKPPISFKNSSSQTSNDPIHDLLQILKKEDDSFAFTRGEDGNSLLICSLKIPFDSISVKDDDFSNAHLKKVIKNAVSQYISIQNPDFNQNSNNQFVISNFLKLLYTKKESFIGSRINKTFMPDDIFEIVKKTIRGLRGFYKREFSGLNRDTVVSLFYDLEDKIINNNNNDNVDDDDSYNTFLSLFFTNDHLDFIQDVRQNLDLYEKKKNYLLKFGLENKPVLCTQDNPKMDYDILDFIIYVCSKVLTNTIVSKIY